MVENPQYKNWARCKPGTTVVQRSVTQTDGIPEQTVTTITSTLTELTDEFAAVRTQARTRRYDGVETNNPPAEFKHPRLMPLAPGVKKEDFGKPPRGAQQGDETISVAGKEYQARWYKTKDRNEAGEVFVTVWTSDRVPGSVLRSVTRVPAVGKTTTLEVVEVTTP